MVFKELASILLLYTIACERINGVAATDGNQVSGRELDGDVMETVFPHIYGNIRAMVNMMQVNRNFREHFQPLVGNIPRLLEFVPNLRPQLFINNGDLTTLCLNGKLL